MHNAICDNLFTCVDILIRKTRSPFLFFLFLFGESTTKRPFRHQPIHCHLCLRNPPSSPLSCFYASSIQFVVAVSVPHVQ